MDETIRINMPKASYIETNGIRLHVMRAGNPDGDPVILLHGFPEFWYGWQKQITPLAEAGYHVIVPDQRGYNLSDKPDGVKAYALENLMNDITGLMDAFNYDKVRLVGHDWGAVVAWSLAMAHPERFEQLVIANISHPHIYKKFVRSNIQQMMKAWYVGFFQIPGISEAILRSSNFAIPSRLMQEQAGLSEREVALYRKAWTEPGAFTAMLNWYRALLQHPPRDNTDGRITVPTLMFWGMNDVALSHEMAQPSIEMCDEGKLIMFKDATHFVQHNKAGRINELMLDFFANGLETVK